ncbi:MAG: phosphoribosyl-ATP diphosphatase [Pseudomonadota bacterium]
MSIEFLRTLEATIESRLDDPNNADSYTVRLAAKGIQRVAQKIGEEGVEVALAAATEASDTELLGEAADLIYHVSVMLKMRGLGLDDVGATLERRHR